MAYAIIILTPDDLECFKDDKPKLQPCARQIDIFELGYFVGKLSRQSIRILVKVDLEKSTNYEDVVYILLDNNNCA